MSDNAVKKAEEKKVWYKTWWFWTIVAVAVAGSGFFIFYK